MINTIESLPMPEWLSHLNSFNINDILNNSLYYPACNFHGLPIKLFMGNTYSFVYVDHWNDDEKLDNVLKIRGFKGYEMIHEESIKKELLLPMGWNIIIPPYENEKWYNSVEHNNSTPFCKWIVFERNSEYDDTYNPKRFSLLYLCADGAAAYQALYLSNKVAPTFLCLINPGLGTDYDKPYCLLHRSVFFRNYETPKYLISFENQVRWPEYDILISRGERGVCLWGRR